MEKQPVICFAVGDYDYINQIKVAVSSFVKYNPTIKLVLFLGDGSSELFKNHIKYDNIEFVDIDDSNVRKFCTDNSANFIPTAYTFDMNKMFNLFIVNHALDIMIHKYRDEYESVLRLDMDVVFMSSILPSVNKFINSGCRCGGCFEYWKRDYGKCGIVENYINAGNFIIRLDNDTISDHMSRSIEIINKVGIDKCNCPDQDALNIIYRHSSKYSANDDGWMLPVSDYADNDNDIIFIHYATPSKPFVTKYTDTYPHVFIDSYKFYRETAKSSGCSEEFIKELDNAMEFLKTTYFGTDFGVDAYIRRMRFRAKFSKCIK